jgi:hypothetical protein
MIMHIVRTYDEHGRILGDRLVPEDTQTSIPDEMSAVLNEAQKKTMAAFIALSFGSGESAYKYDPQGRVIEKRVTRDVLGDEVTALHYNDRGDVAEEETTRMQTAATLADYSMDDAGNMVATQKRKTPGPSRSTMHYTYEYDAQGNWTSKTESIRSDPGGEFKVSRVLHRTLTYY